METIGARSEQLASLISEKLFIWTLLPRPEPGPMGSLGPTWTELSWNDPQPTRSVQGGEVLHTSSRREEDGS